jgi:hypothetical protein
MMKNFRTRQNQRSLFLDFRPENGMNSCRKWDGFRRMGEWGEWAKRPNGNRAEARVTGRRVRNVLAPRQRPLHSVGIETSLAVSSAKISKVNKEVFIDVLEVKLTEHHGFYHAFRIGDNIGWPLKQPRIRAEDSSPGAQGR